VLEGLAIKKFHGDEGAGVFFADVVDGADVGVIESGGGFGFAAEAGEGLRVVSDFGREKFEGDEAVEACVLSLKDNAHAATTEPLKDAIVRYGLTE